MKKLICVVFLAATLLLSALCGCGMVRGVDGRDGQDLSIYEIYEAANATRVEEGLEEISFLDFLREYLHYDFAYSESESVQTIMNRSLMSAVAILTGFKYRSGFSFETEYYVGSGVIVDIDRSAGDAYILTNCHVVYDDSSMHTYADEIYIFLYGADDLTVADRNDYISAEIVGVTMTYDLALLKVKNNKNLKNSEAVAATFAESEEVYAGSKVYAIGNPMGSGISITTGIISRESEVVAMNLSSAHADDEKYLHDYRVIRTDAAVNGGNSGGGLFNSNGKLVGIINSKALSGFYEDGDDYYIDDIEGMGYALAGSYAKRIYQLMRDGYYSKTSPSGLNRAVFPTKYSYTSSAYFDNKKNVAVITDKVVVSGAAEGLSRGDVIERIRVLNGSGQAVEDMYITRHFNVDDLLLSAREGYKIVYTVLRGAERLNITTAPYFKRCD